MSMLDVLPLDQDVYAQALQDLEFCLHHDLDESRRAALLASALTQLEEPLRQQTDIDQSLTGIDTEYDRSHQTLFRRQEKLRQEHANLLEECLALKWECRQAAANGLPASDALVRRIADLAARLKEMRAEAVYLVLESFTVDMGAGD